MLLIRQAQMDALRQAATENAVERIADYLCGRQPLQAASRSRQEILEIVEAARRQSAEYGITLEWDVCRYAEQLLIHGPGFHMTDWAAPLLADEYFSGTEKMDRIEYHHLHILKGQSNG